jgi:YidC/Oxa1 family membrane protein insertase
MDKNTWIGLLLIALIIIGFTWLGNDKRDARQEAKQTTTVTKEQPKQPAQGQIVSGEQQPETYGAFTIAAQGESRAVTLENNKVKLYIDPKGGVVRQAELKEYKSYGDSVNNLCLFKGKESDLYFVLYGNGYTLTTKDLYFEPQASEPNQVVMRLKTDSADVWMDFIYTLEEDDYMTHFSIRPHHIGKVLATNDKNLPVYWHQMIPQQEKGRKFEDRYAQLQYMYSDGDVEEMKCENKIVRKQEKSRVKWIAYKDQFFSTVLIADAFMESPDLTAIPHKDDLRYIKEYSTSSRVPFEFENQETSVFRFYFGPNHYHTLKSYDKGVDKEHRLRLNKLVPLGWKIVSWINTALVIPMFDLFTSWGLHIGIVILLMTIVIKLIILPFVFVSYKSSAKMRALRPQIDAINEKYPAEKMQERQAATMQLYQQAGVNPMSGCLPMLFQFPVLMAMFWFLPTAIELRGKSLWWANDLSTYDAVFQWGFNIPLLGDHLSLFCLLMTICNIGYTYITMQSQATDPNMKFMKYMMYAMPLMFLFIFNDYAAGLSYYYLVSLFITILQTMIFRWTLDDKKMLAEIEANKKKKAGKPKSGFMQRLENMQREQQRLAREQAKAANKRR